MRRQIRRVLSDMAKRIIVQSPDPILSKKCRPVEAFDGKLHTLLDDMKDTLEAADGAGLAAPQVSVLRRACIVSTEDGFFELINPVLVSAEGKQTGIEGCLSVKGKYGTVTRAEKIKVEADDRFGKNAFTKSAASRHVLSSTKWTTSTECFTPRSVPTCKTKNESPFSRNSGFFRRRTARACREIRRCCRGDQSRQTVGTRLRFASLAP